MGVERTLPQDCNQVESTGGCVGREEPEVRAKLHPAGLSNEIVRLFGQEPSVYAMIVVEGG